MYFIPFRKIFQSHSAGFHKKEDRKEGTEGKASSPSAPPFLLPLRPVRISPCQFDSALLHLTGGYRPMKEKRKERSGKQALPPLLPFFFRSVPSAFRRASSIPLCFISLWAIALWKKKGGDRGENKFSPLSPPFFFRTAQCYSIKLVGSTGSPSLSISKYRLGPSTL